MLEMKKSITVTGKSVINGQEVCGYQATIESESPENINFSSWQTNKPLYKANRTECRADEAAFEDECYELQDELLTAKNEETAEV